MKQYEVSSEEEEDLPFACYICREHFKNPVVTRYSVCVCVCVCVCVGVVILNSHIIAMYFCVGGGLSYWLLGTHT